MLDGIRSSFILYVQPANDYVHLNRNRSRIARYDALFNRFGCARAPDALHLGEQRHPVYLSLLLGLPLLFVLSVRRMRRLTDRARRGTLVFMLGTIAYATLVFNLLELGENNRFRFALDPLFVVLLGLFLQRVSRRVGAVLRRLGG